MKIAVVGTGYVGLVTGTCFAETGNDVTCVDIDAQKVERLRRGEVPIYEPDLDKLFARNIQEGRLHFTTSLEEGVEDAVIIFLALPTPPREDGSADLSYVLKVSEDLGPLLKNYTVVIDKSTVPVGTADKVRAKIAETAKVAFDVASNPEFLREGFAVNDFLHPDRVVVGTSSARAREVLEELYAPFVRENNPLYFMDERSAEMTKYAANSFLATKITFMNEIANLCELLGADVDQVRLGIGSDDRIGRRFLFPGIGYGGSCFPKDVMALSHTAEEYGYDFKILGAVTGVNKQQKQRLVEKVRAYYDGKLEGKTFALWGLAFKPDTDDVREAPAREIVTLLLESGAKVVAYDPEATANFRSVFGEHENMTYAGSMYEALQDADALLIATEWSEFTTPDFDAMKRSLREPTIFDGRNIYELKTMEQQGFYYASIGRSSVARAEA